MPTSSLDKFSETELADCFDYLDTLRESGITNMFGAAPYVAKEFRIKKDRATDVLKAWMHTFSRDIPANERARTALAGKQT